MKHPTVVDLSQFDDLCPRMTRTIMFNSIFSDSKTPRFTRSIRRLLWAVVFVVTSTSAFVFHASTSLWAKDLTTMSNALGMGYNFFTFVVRSWAFARSADFVKETLFLRFDGFHSNHFLAERACQILKESRRHVLKVHRFVSILLRMNTLSWLLFPLVPQIYNLMNGASYEDVVKKLPTAFMIETGWSHKELKYCYELFVAVVLIELWSSTICLFYAVVYLVNAQYRILSESVKKIGEKHGYYEMPAQLKYMIEDQLKLRRISIQLKTFMRPILSAILVNVIFMTSLSLTSLTMQPRTTNQSEMIARLFNAALSIFIAIAEFSLYCYLSEKLSSANSSFSYAVYTSIDSYRMTGSSKAAVNLSMLICSREIRLDASKMIVLRLSTVVDILKFTYSYCALLNESIHE